MPTLPLIITDAGRQAIVDATNTGTLPVVLSQVALGTGKWAPDATALALQAELKRINTIGGLVVAADTIHVTITDASTDAYALGEFGLYTDGGVLFAIYSDLAGITDKAADALLLLANDIVLTSVPAGSVTVGSTEFTNPLATETLPGVAEIATQAESDAGTDDARIVTPKKAQTSAAAYTYTANQALATPANTGTITQLVSWLAGLIKGITGKSDWKTAPATTLEAAATHASSTAPHSATSAATADRLMLRDVSGRAKVAAPSAADDIARLDTVNNAITALLDSSPGTLDTLNELAAALGDDPNFATTMTNALAAKLDKVGGTLTGAVTTPSGSGFLAPGGGGLRSLTSDGDYYYIAYSGNDARPGFVVAGYSANHNGALFRVIKHIGGPVVFEVDYAGRATVAQATLAGHAVNLGQFPSSLAANGYQKLPSGFIEQWGRIDFLDTAVTVTLPIAFPNACVSVIATVDSAAPTVSATQAAKAHIVSQSQIKVMVDSYNSVGDATGAYWFAVGY